MTMTIQMVILRSTLSELNASEIHFCGDEDDGHMKKDKWVKAYSNTQYGEDDDDNDKYWFWNQQER